MTNNRRQMTDWLPTTKKEMNLRGWEEADVILFSGDAYIDHPSFGTAVIGRLLEKEGLKVAVVPQPNWRDDLRDFRKFGKPNLFFAVTAGVMDSMINHYTANKRLRSNDAYTPDGRSDMRPDRAVTVYSKILKDLYPDVPIVLGGIEASLRRVTHYDYWDDSLHKTILAETGADLLIYGMGELPLKQLIKNIREGRKISEIYDLPQSAFLINKKSIPENPFKEEVALFSHEECLKDKLKQAKNFRVVEEQSNRISAARILQAVDDKVLIVNPPYPPMKEEEIDTSFDLPYTRLPHPKYKGKHIPAYEMIKFSVNMHRGCFGGCAFCTISAHQGKFIASRTKESILNEVKQITEMPDHIVMSFITIFSFSIPPSGIIPILPLPSGSVSSHLLAGSEKLSVNVCLSVLFSHEHRNIIIPANSIDCNLVMKPDYLYSFEILLSVSKISTFGNKKKITG
jgi:uncharacterized radical SAM protein YgiQ